MGRFGALCIQLIQWFALLMIYCTSPVHSKATRDILLRQYKYLIMSRLHVKDKFFLCSTSNTKPTLLFLCYILTTTLLLEPLRNYYNQADCPLHNY